MYTEYMYILTQVDILLFKSREMESTGYMYILTQVDILLFKSTRMECILDTCLYIPIQVDILILKSTRMACVLDTCILYIPIQVDILEFKSRRLECILDTCMYIPIQVDILLFKSTRMECVLDTCISLLRQIFYYSRVQGWSVYWIHEYPYSGRYSTIQEYKDGVYIRYMYILTQVDILLLKSTRMDCILDTSISLLR